MKVLYIVVALIFLSGCATTTTSITDPDTGVVFTMKTRTLFKDIQDAEGDANIDGFRFSLGSSTPTEDAAGIANLLGSMVSRITADSYQQGVRDGNGN